MRTRLVKKNLMI